MDAPNSNIEVSNVIHGDTSRYICIGMLLLILLLPLTSRDAILWLLIGLPLIIGLMFPIFRNDGFTAKAAGLGPFVAKRMDRANTANGKLATFVRRPLWRTLNSVWQLSHRIPDSHLRIGVQVTSFTYVFTAFAFLAVFLIYLVIAIVLIL